MAFVTFPFSTRNIFFSLLLVLIWIKIPNTASAQSVYEQIGRLPTTIYTQEEIGSQSPTFWTAIQSESGLMYFGSTDNLYEYDGVSWSSVFRTPIGVIRTLTKDPKGRIFYAGNDLGYLETDSTGETQAISLLHLIPEELQVNFHIWTINFLDQYILLQTNAHIIRLELSEDYKLKSLKSWKAETGFTMSFLYGEDYFISQAGKGLFQLIDDEVKLISGTEMLGQDRFTIMLPYGDSGKAFLLGDRNSGFYLLGEEGLSKYPTQVDELLKGGTTLYRAFTQNGNYVLSLIGEGVVIMNPQGEILRKFDTDQGLHSDVIYHGYEDQAGGIWVMTDDGIARVAINSPIQTFGKEMGINSTVLSIQKNGDELFLGTNNGLVKFDSEEMGFHSVSDIKTGQIFNLKSDGEDFLVAGGPPRVLRDGETIQLEGAKDGSSTIDLKIPKATPNLMYVGTSTQLSVYRRGLSKEIPWEYVGKVPGIDTQVQYMFEDKEWQLWAVGGGVISLVKLGETGLESGNLNSIKVTGFETSQNTFFSGVEGEFFISNNDGLGWQKYSNTAGKFVPAEEFKALGDEMVDLNQNKSGIVWMQSKNGKKYILKRQADGTFIKDDKPNVIAPYLSYADFVDQDSIFWFGNPKGLVRYDPKKDVQDEKQFFTLIRRIESKTDTLPLIQYGRNKDVAALERKDNSLRFEFAAPYFEEEQKTKYQTYLEGFESEWTDWNNNKYKEYTNLSPGEYTFRVRALANSGQVSEEASYSFVVLPPWFATWWAYLIYGVLAALIITGIIKWRSRKLKAENRKLEKKVHERTAQLEKSITDLKSTQAQLIQSEKMASLGELTAGIAHEIQNPLNFVNNFSEVSTELLVEMDEELDKGDVKEAKLLSKNIRENLQKITHHGKRADSIVKGMLQHSRGTSGETKATNINAMAEEYLRLSYQGYRARDKNFKADFKTEFDEDLPRIEVVRQDLGRVLLNLINNAFYAVSERSKTATVHGGNGSATIEDFKPLVIVSTKNLGDKIQISVRDNGSGIPSEIKDKIFQPFFTTKPTGQGTGLGLSLSYDIVKAHGGELKVSSQPGETIFEIALPI